MTRLMQGRSPTCGDDRRLGSKAIKSGPATIHFEPCHTGSARSMNDPIEANVGCHSVIETRVVRSAYRRNGFDSKGAALYRNAASARDAGSFPRGDSCGGALTSRGLVHERTRHQNPQPTPIEGNFFFFSGPTMRWGHHWGTFHVRAHNEERDGPKKMCWKPSWPPKSVAPERFRPAACRAKSGRGRTRP